jgi:hypothetical protein
MYSCPTFPVPVQFVGHEYMPDLRHFALLIYRFNLMFAYRHEFMRLAEYLNVWPNGI